MSRRRGAMIGILLLVSVSVVIAAHTPPVNKDGSIRPVQPVVLALVNPGAPIELQPFVDAVDRLSAGALQIHLDNDWHGGQATAEADVIRHVQAGRAPLGVAPVRTWNGVGVRAFDALIAPFAVDSLALERRVLDSGLINIMLRRVAAVGLAGIGVLPGPIRRPVGITHEFLGPNDYRGKRFGISASVVAARTFRALHATAVPSLFAGRPIDTFDGIEQQIGSVDGNRYDQTASTVTANVNLWPRPLVVFANSKSYAALTDGQQKILQAAAKAAIPATMKLDGEKESLGNLCRRNRLRFVTASATALHQLDHATEPVRTWLRRDPLTSQALDRIGVLRADVISARDVEPPPTCTGVASGPQNSQPLRRATPLDGVYAMSTTYADGVAAGAPPGDHAPENYGNWVFVVDRGLFAFTQENKLSCTWGYGTWHVTGKLLQWRFTDGGGQAPTPATNKPGEYFVFGWSLYRDTLTLTHASGQISPENFLAKPWQRLSRTPSPGRLSQRCPPPAQALPSK